MHMHKNLTPGRSLQSADVAFALTGDPRQNSRALRQLDLLSDLDLRILVFGLGDPSDIRDLNIRNVTLQYLPRPAGKGAKFFWHVHQQFVSALRNITSSIYHASDLYTLPAMNQAARHHGAHLIFDSRELYTHLPAAIRRPWVRAAWTVVQHRHIRQADCVYTVSESIARHLREHFRLNTVHVMHNVPRLRTSVPGNSFHKHFGLPPNIKVVLHQGNLQPHRGAAAMVEAMRHTADAILIFMGGGPLKSDIQRLVSKSGLDARIRFMDPVHPDQLLSYTASADLGLTFLEDCCLNHRYALPNKLFEYLAAGVPVIASDLPEITKIITRFEVGRVVPSGNAAALGQALDHAIKTPELRKKWIQNTACVQEFFNFATEAEHFITPYQSLLDR